MTHSRCVARYTPRPSTCEALWITDDILAAAFHRFTRAAHIRHGSNVPGPLEARKRSTNRRRNTTFAHIQNAGPPIDAAMLFGKAQQVDWWNLSKKTDTPASLLARYTEGSARIGEGAAHLSESMSQIRPAPRALEATGSFWDSASPELPDASNPPTSDSADLPEPATSWLIGSIPEVVIDAAAPVEKPAEPPPLGAQIVSMSSNEQVLMRSISDQIPMSVWASEDSDLQVGRDMALSPSISQPVDKSIVSVPVRSSERAIVEQVSADYAAGPSGRLQQSFLPEGDDSLGQSLQDRDPYLLDRDPYQLDEQSLSDAFEHAINERWPTSAVAETPHRSKFHPPGSDHHVGYIRYLYKHNGEVYTRNQKDQIFEDIERAVRTSNVSIGQWLQLARHALSRISNRDKEQKIKNHSLSRAKLEFVMLVNNYELNESLTLNMTQDGDAVARDALFNQLYRTSHMTIAVWALCALQRSMSEIDVSLVSRAFTRWLDFNGESTWSLEEDDRLVRTLLDFPRDVQAEIVGRITASCFEVLLTPHPERKRLTGWRRLLLRVKHHELSDRNVDQVIAQKLLSLIPNSHSQMDRMLIFLWFLYHRHEISTIISISEQTWSLRTLFDLQGIDVLMCFQIVFRADFIFSSEESGFLRKLELILEGLLPEQDSQQTRAVDLLRGEQHALTTVLHDDMYLEARKSGAQQLEGLIARLNSNLNAFQQLIPTLVTSNKLNLRLITRILRHNEPLRHAIAQSWPDFPAHHRPLNKLEFTQQSLESINILAVACALSRSISDRQAFTKVQWCFQFLLDNKAPLQFPITRALWHAGVMRRGAACPEPQLDWIARIVAQVEGPQVAQRLLYNANFRTQRAATFEELGMMGAFQALDDRGPGPLDQLQHMFESTESPDTEDPAADVTNIARAIQQQAETIKQDEIREQQERLEIQKLEQASRAEELSPLAQHMGLMQSSFQHRIANTTPSWLFDDKAPVVDKGPYSRASSTNHREPQTLSPVGTPDAKDRLADKAVSPNPPAGTLDLDQQPPVCNKPAPWMWLMSAQPGAEDAAAETPAPTTQAKPKERPSALRKWHHSLRKEKKQSKRSRGFDLTRNWS